MKKNLSLAGFSLVAMGLFLGSCVSKRKYMEAQTSATERYRTDSTQWADRSNTMQQNITSLEQKNTIYQKQADSLRTASMNYQKRWDNIQTTYTEQTASTEQLHRQIHGAIDQYVEASNVESSNGKIYVNLPEKMLFNAGSSTLSTKGKDALDKLSVVLAANDNFDVDIITTAAYYNDGTTASITANSPAVNNATTADNSILDKTSQPSTAPVSESAPVSGSVTSGKTQQDPAVKSKATTKSSTIKKSSTASSGKKNQGDRSMSFKSTPKSTKKKASTAPSWNLNVARSTAIVRELTQKGLPQARIVLIGQNGKGITTNEWAATNRGYQVVVSPKMDSYYQKIQEGQGSTSMIK